MASNVWMAQESSSRGSLTVDKDELDQRFLQCSVCYDKFDQKIRIPKTLPACHHCFCQPCLQELLNNVRPTTSSVAFRNQGYVRYVTSCSGMLYALSCPACRQMSSLTTRNAHTLPTDYKVLDMLDFFSKKGRQPSMCNKHHQPLNFFCDHCTQPICRDCTLIDHRERDGHTYSDIRDAFSKFEVTLKAQVGNMKSLSEQYEERETNLKKTLQDLTDMHIATESSITQFFDNCSRELEDRRERLKAELNEAVENERTITQEKLATVAAKREMLKDKASALDAGITCGNLHEAFFIHREFKDHADNMHDDSLSSDAQRTIEFIPSGAENYQELVNNLGGLSQAAPVQVYVQDMESSEPRCTERGTMTVSMGMQY